MTREEHWRWFRITVYFILWTTLCGLVGTCFVTPRAKGSPLPFRLQARFPPGVYYAGAGTYIRLAADGTASIDDVWLYGLGCHTGTWSDRKMVIRVEQWGRIREFLKEDLRRRE